MERTYDVFADNGLYVLAYYLNKEVEDVTHEDIENSIDMMGEKVEGFLDCEKYSNLKNMFLFNSTVSNPSLKGVKLSTALRDFLEQKGEEYCVTCGEYHANTKMNFKGRSYLPNRPSGTFFNFSNNLHNINVCPYCLVLTTYSVMNCRVDNHVFLYNSSDDDVLKYFTKLRQTENKQDIAIKAEKSKQNKKRLETLLELIDSNRLFESEVEIYRFNNGKTEEIPEAEKIYSENIKLLRKMENKSLLGEFRQLGLTWMIIDNKLKSNYISYVYDFENEELKCSRELFDFLNEEINMLDKNTIELIDRITKSIVDAKLDIRKIRTTLRAVKSLKSFDNALMNVQEMYYEKTDERLFDKEEYNQLTNVRKYSSIKNMMIIDLI